MRNFFLAWHQVALLTKLWRKKIFENLCISSSVLGNNVSFPPPSMSSSSIAIRIKWGERVKVGFLPIWKPFLQILNKTAEYELKWVRQCGDSTTLKKGLTHVPRILTDEIPQICKSVLSSTDSVHVIPAHSRHGSNLFPENLKISPSAVSPAGWNPPLWRLNPPGFLPKLSSWLKTNRENQPEVALNLI